MIDHPVLKELPLQLRNMNLLSAIYQKMHQRYRFLVQSLNILTLLASILIISAVLIDPKLLLLLQITPEKTELIIRYASISLFLIAILSLSVGWGKKAAIYGQASEMVIKLQAECREILNSEATAELLRQKSLLYSAMIHLLPKIPDSDYYKFKAYHKRRIELERLTETYPGSSIMLLKLFIIYRANIHLMLRKPFLSKTDEPDPENKHLNTIHSQ